MREQVRNMDRAMSNIESMPGGFNALAQFHSSMQVGRLEQLCCVLFDGRCMYLGVLRAAACTW
jgi:hypothetical protein